MAEEETRSDDPKFLRAEAKAAKARAKAMRPWYKKKRYVLGGIVLLLVVIGSISSALSGNKTNSTTPKASPLPQSAVAASTPKGCSTKFPKYPGEQPTHDCVALANGSVAIANTTVTASWTRTSDNLGNSSICAAVSIVNQNNSTISYNDLYWSLQTPSGKVEDTNFAASNDLGSGNIIGGGSTTGNVCFDDPGQAGTYVGIYKPDPFSARRGIWIFTP